MNYKLAIFRDATGFQLVSHLDMTTSGYTRISDYMFVDFPPLQDVDVQAQVAGLEAQERKLRETYQRDLERIAKHRDELLALPAPDAT